MNLHFGCGTVVGPEWYNCDGSLTVRLQRLPVVGAIFRQFVPPRFPSAVHFGDVARGLDIAPNSCDAVFCSHVLEHLALEELRQTLRNVYTYMKPGGVFRAVLPDLGEMIRLYNENPGPEAAINFMTWTGLGVERRPRSINGLLRAWLGGSRHMWMWDFKSMRVELEKVGFRDIQPTSFNASSNPVFKSVEDPERFRWNPLAFECVK